MLALYLDRISALIVEGIISGGGAMGGMNTDRAEESPLFFLIFPLSKGVLLGIFLAKRYLPGSERQPGGDAEEEFLLSIQNPTIVREADDDIRKSGKKDRDNLVGHGIGLRSVERILHSHGGELAMLQFNRRHREVFSCVFCMKIPRQRAPKCCPCILCASVTVNGVNSNLAITAIQNLVKNLLHS